MTSTSVLKRQQCRDNENNPHNVCINNVWVFRPFGRKSTFLCNILDYSEFENFQHKIITCKKLIILAFHENFLLIGYTVKLAKFYALF